MVFAMPSESENIEDKRELKASLKPRHILMISIGGTIGAGFFLGIAEPLKSIGALSTILAYGFAGLVLLGTMMCLSELSTAFPHSGSFQYFAYRLFKTPSLSFMIGWLYWLSWVFSIGASLIAAGLITNEFFPSIDVWVWCAFFLLVLILINAMSAGAFGECEYWLAALKVFAIIFFIFCGIILIGMRIRSTGTLPTLATENGYFPQGWLSAIGCMTVVIYSFQGVELIGNVAGETKNPEKVIPGVIRGIGARILIFYISAVAILAFISPNGHFTSAAGPFVDVFNQLGIPSAETFMKIVILSASLSGANSGIYASSRMFWAMANTGMAPKYFGVVSKHHVPLRAICLCGFFSLVCVLSKHINAYSLFVFLISSTAQVGCLAWMVIGACQLRYRNLVHRGVMKSNSKIWLSPLYPWTGIFVIAVNAFIIISGWWGEDGIEMFLAEMILVAVIYLCYRFFYKSKNIRFDI